MADWSLSMGVAAMLALIAAIGIGVADANATSAAPTLADCKGTFFKLIPCLLYVTGKDAGKPSKFCCNDLASIMEKDPMCLCPFLTENDINQTQFRNLPHACNGSSPLDTSNCNAVIPGVAGAPGPSGIASPHGTSGGSNVGTIPALSMGLSIFMAGVSQYLLFDSFMCF